MRNRTYGFENLKVASPCHESWDNMTGDERVKFCGACERPVYNLSSLTGHEIAELIRNTEGKRTCVRFYRRADGTILTQDCPVGHQKARRKTIGLVAAGFASALGIPAAMNWNKEPEILMGIMVKDPAIMGEMIIPPEELKDLSEDAN